MEQENLNKLRQIMTAEQEAYRARLLEMPPAEILNHAWEYTAREDILMALDSWEPSKEKAAALLKSSSPLEAAGKEYRDQGVDNERIIDALDDAVKLYVEPPIYRQTVEYAMEHGERDAYFDSRKEYQRCRWAIDESIRVNNNGYTLGDRCVKDVIALFSAERVKNVLAYTIASKPWDGRFSWDNKEWANSVDTSHMGEKSFEFVSRSHPAVLDSFVSKFRREVLERDTAEKSAEKPQCKPKERSGELEL